MKETRFKDTEIGRIPEDWDLYLLGNKSEIYRGGSPRPIEAYLTELPSGINWIKIGDVKHGDKYIRRTAEKIIASGAARSRSVEPGDFILSNSMSFGRPYILAIDGCIHDGWLVIKNYQTTYNKDFLYYVLGSSAIVEQYKIMAAGSSVQNLNKDKVAGVKVITPTSKEEQSRIASALTAIDNLISSLDKLIEKKKNIKQGTMQQLLTGKKRLNGFNEPWVEKKLEQVEIRKGSMLKSTDYIVGGIPVIAGGKIPAGFHSTPNRLGNTITISSSGANAGYVAYYKRPIFASDCSTINEQEGVNVEYMYYSLLLYQNEIYKCQTGGAQPHIHAKDIKDITVLMPKDMVEQSTIASVLTSMDNAVAALEAKKAKYEQIKQGMMQQLLTGKIRLVESASESKARKANIHFKRSVVAAEIADRLCEEPTFGHVKMMKMLFLAERLCHIELDSHYHRDAAGPYDNRALRSIDGQLKRQGWFEAKNVGGRIVYIPLQRRGNHKKYFNKYYAGCASVLDKITETFRTMTTEQCEIVATLFSAWEDLLHAGKSCTENDIVNEVLNNWHESKQRISREHWLNAIVWMRREGFVPQVETL